MIDLLATTLTDLVTREGRADDAPQLPAPRDVGYAIADCAREVLGEATAYCEAFDALARARVPAKFRRELLADELPESEPRRVVREWDGSNSALIVAGHVGVAKSHAAAWWVATRLRRNQHTHWESVASWGSLEFEGLRARVRMLLKLSAIVLDDLGAGSLNRWHREMVETLIVERHADEKTTIVVFNLSVAKDAPAPIDQLANDLGRRALDRIRSEGGRIHINRNAKSLRHEQPEVDANGRTPEHRNMLWLLQAVGHTVVETGTWIETEHGQRAGPIERRVQYGDALAKRLVDFEREGRPWVAEAERVRLAAGVNVRDLLARASTIASTYRGPDDVDDLVKDTFRRMAERESMEKKARRAFELQARRRDDAKLGRRRGQLAAQCDALRVAQSVAAPTLDRAQLESMGVTVKLDGETWAVYHAPMRTATKGRKRGLSVAAKPVRKAEGFATDILAWEWAPTLFGEPLRALTR